MAETVTGTSSHHLAAAHPPSGVLPEPGNQPRCLRPGRGRINSPTAPGLRLGGNSPALEDDDLDLARQIPIMVIEPIGGLCRTSDLESHDGTFWIAFGSVTAAVRGAVFFIHDRESTSDEQVGVRWASSRLGKQRRPEPP
jgi:hypothetical protein